MGYPTCAILRTDLQAVLLRRAREAGVPVAFGREATAIANDPDGRAVVHFADGGRLSPDLVIGADGRMSSVARAHVAGGNAPVYQGFVNWIGVAESSRDLVTALPSTTIGGMASASASWRWGGARSIGRARRRRRWSRRARRRPPRRTASGARCAACSKLARSHRRGHRCHAAAGPAPDRGARPGAAGPLASRQCAAGGRRRARALPTSGQGACQALEDAWHLARCLEDPAMGPGAELEQALERFGGLRRRRRRPSHGRRGTSRESCSSRTRRLAASATHACAPAIRCKACMRWRKAGAGPAFAGAGAGRSRAATVAGSGADGSGNVGHELAGRPRGVRPELRRG